MLVEAIYILKLITESHRSSSAKLEYFKLLVFSVDPSFLPVLSLLFNSFFFSISSSNYFGFLFLINLPLLSIDNLTCVLPCLSFLYYFASSLNRLLDFSFFSIPFSKYFAFLSIDCLTFAALYSPSGFIYASPCSLSCFSYASSFLSLVGRISSVGRAFVSEARDPRSIHPEVSNRAKVSS